MKQSLCLTIATVGMLMATAASANEYHDTSRTATAIDRERASTVSCTGVYDNSTSVNVIQKGGANTRRAIGRPIPNSSCYPNFTDSRYSPAATYDANGNLIRYERRVSR